MFWRLLSFFGLVMLLWCPVAAVATTNSYVLPIHSGFNLLSVQLDVGNNSIQGIFWVPYALRESSIHFIPAQNSPASAFSPGAIYFVISNNVVVTASESDVVFLDPFDVTWIWGGQETFRPWPARLGMLFCRCGGYGQAIYNLTLTGTDRVESGTPIDLRPGGWVLLGREVMGIGTYENVIGRSPQEGHKVMRLRPGAMSYSYPYAFSPSDLTTYTFTDGAWVPQPPQLNIGEAAWFYAPAPLLQLTTAGTNAVLKWPAASIDMQLQCAPQCGTSMTWTNVTQMPATNGTQLTVTVPVNPTQPQFYRLRSKL